eukprot:317133_1
MSCSNARGRIMTQHRQAITSTTNTQETIQTNQYIKSHIDVINNKAWNTGSNGYIFDNGRFKGKVMQIHYYTENDCLMATDGTKICGKVLFQWDKTINTDQQTNQTYFIIHLEQSSGVSHLRGDFSLAPVPNSKEDIEGRKVATSSSMRHHFDPYTTTSGLDLFTKTTVETLLEELYQVQCEHNRQENVLNKNTKANVDMHLQTLWKDIYKGVKNVQNIKRVKDLLISIQNQPKNNQTMIIPSNVIRPNASNGANNNSNENNNNNSTTAETGDMKENDNKESNDNSSADSRRKRNNSTKGVKQKCPFCPKSYTVHYLKNHIRRHQDANIDWITCGKDGCTKKFQTQEQVNNHQKQGAHAVKRTLINSKCPYCKKNLKKSERLNKVFCSNKNKCGFNTSYKGDNADY